MSPLRGSPSLHVSDAGIPQFTPFPLLQRVLTAKVDHVNFSPSEDTLIYIHKDSISGQRFSFEAVSRRCSKRIYYSGLEFESLTDWIQYLERLVKASASSNGKPQQVKSPTPIPISNMEGSNISHKTKKKRSTNGTHVANVGTNITNVRNGILFPGEMMYAPKSGVAQTTPSPRPAPRR